VVVGPRRGLPGRAGDRSGPVGPAAAVVVAAVVVAAVVVAADVDVDDAVVCDAVVAVGLRCPAG
jgi:hypothetical protein